MADEAAPTPEQLKAAIKAFKKKLKLARLDAESGFTRNPVTAGRSSGIVAITPPDQFPPAVWEELARQGRLKKGSGGTYGLAAE